MCVEYLMYIGLIDFYRDIGLYQADVVSTMHLQGLLQFEYQRHPPLKYTVC